MREIVVSKKAAKSLREFFPWVYKSDILTSLEGFGLGDIVRAVDESGAFLAVGYINPNSTITLRVLSYKDEKVDDRHIHSKILRALAKRKRSGLDTNACRLIHSEADFLPGLIVDRYEDYLSVMFLTVGILRFKETIIDSLLNLIEPKGIYIQGEKSALKKEGIEPFEEMVGQIPSKVVIEEHGIKFYVDILNAQKTGFYLDQRKNRKIVSDYIKQKDKVLDCFSNTGGFGLYAKVRKNADVRLVDISKEAMEMAKENFALNEVTGEFVVANVFDYLRELRRSKEKFDCIILDPPSFAKSKSKRSSALKGFKDITVNAMKILEREGHIALFSCSHHIGMEDLKSVVKEAAKDNNKAVEIQELLYQDIDHPYILNNEYSLYLKGLLFKFADL
ncbi:MAG: class I SAM-dependent rRNA methyltransferase [Epsilonproteobacteria bacterium]|nr:class I SAM-dependent rRNA methyltransferase [Campylobacterota bacterium]NPA63908.1 class I SAM-dependent rRNA methyltransferase [Campylobacterota bacterium]